MDELIAISELARRTEVTTSTLRYYDELGLVSPATRVSGHRRYSADAVNTVAIIKLLQEVGFSLAETKIFLSSHNKSLRTWRSLVERKSDELRRKIAAESVALEALEHGLKCPAKHVFDCPNFMTITRGVLTGLDLAEAHAHAHSD